MRKDLPPGVEPLTAKGLRAFVDRKVLNAEARDRAKVRLQKFQKRRAKVRQQRQSRARNRHG